jgi:hypothetical protein
MFLDENISSVPPPSTEAVYSIIDVINKLDKGDRDLAARWLQASSKAASPILFAWDDLRFINDAISKGITEITRAPSPMRYDFVHYAIWAIRLNLTDLITDNEMLEHIETFRNSPPPVETSPILDDRYKNYLSSHGNKASLSKSYIRNLFKKKSSPKKNR